MTVTNTFSTAATIFQRSPHTQTATPLSKSQESSHSIVKSGDAADAGQPVHSVYGNVVVNSAIGFATTTDAIVAPVDSHDDHSSDPTSLQPAPIRDNALCWRCCVCDNNAFIAIRWTQCIICNHPRCGYCPVY